MNKLYRNIFIFLLVLVISGMNNFLSVKIGSRAALSPIIFLISILIITYYLNKGGRLILSQPTVKLFYIAFFSFLLLGGLAAIFHNNGNRIIGAYRFYLPSLLIYWCGVLGFFYLLRTKTFIQITMILRWALIINTIVVIFTYFTNSSFFEMNEPGSSISGFHGNTNISGFSANLLFAIELNLLRTKSSKFSYIIIPMVLMHLLIGFSRSSLITCAVIFLHNILYTGKIISLKGSSRVIAFSVLLIIISVFSFSETIKNMVGLNLNKWFELQELFSGKINENTTSQRSYLAEIGWNRIKENPILGSGIHTFAKFDDTIGSGVHNQYLLILGESGIFPFIAYLFIHSLLWYKAIKLENNQKLVIQSFLLAILIYSISNHTMYGNKNYIIILSFIISVIAYQDMTSRSNFMVAYK